MEIHLASVQGKKTRTSQFECIQDYKNEKQLVNVYSICLSKRTSCEWNENKFSQNIHTFQINDLKSIIKLK